MELKKITVIDCHEIETEIGIHYTGLEIAQTAENGSYIPLECDDNDIAEIEEAIDWELGKEGLTINEVKYSTNNYLKRLVNQHTLMKHLRENYGLMFVLVNIYW